MEALAEANADAKEIDDTIRIGGDVAVGVDDDDLAEELAALVEEADQDDKEVEEVRRKLGILSPSSESESETPALEREKVAVLAT
jgi:charged multivesicular body protein 7